MSSPQSPAPGASRKLCRVLREAHAVGLIHRDIKPGNIFVTELAFEATMAATP